MKVSDTISKPVIAAATNLLLPFAPDLTAQKLIAAIKAYELEQPDKLARFEKPLTRQDVAHLLSCSLLTVDRYLNAGKLDRITLSRKAVRISPESYRRFVDASREKTD